MRVIGRAGFALFLILTLLKARTGTAQTDSSGVDCLTSEAANDSFQSALQTFPPNQAHCDNPPQPSWDFAAISPNLKDFDEKKALSKDSLPLLFAVKDHSGMIHQEKRALILVHGLYGSPADFQALTERVLATGKFQLYVLAFHDATRHIEDNAKDIAEVLRHLKRESSGARQTSGITLVAHSMGGVVSRAVLNELSFGERANSRPFGPVHLIAIDSPWLGFPGPSDHGVDRVMSGFAGLFSPPAVMDMRARSDFFQGDSSSKDLARRKGLLQTVLPPTVQIDLIFADEGIISSARNKDDEDLKNFIPAVLSYYKNDRPFAGNSRLVNFWMALKSSYQFKAFDDAMMDLEVQGKLDRSAATRLLARYFPSYPGDHASVLAARPQGDGAIDAILRLAD